MQWGSSTSHNQPLHTLPPSLPSSPFSHPHLHSSHSPAAPPSIPFGQVPGSQPGQLGWGIGMSAANQGGFGWAAQTQGRSPAGAGGAGAARQPSVGWGSAAGPSSPSSTSHTPTNPRRRRRSASPDSSDDEANQQQQARAVRPIRPALASTKRARTAGDAAGLSAGGLGLGGASGSGSGAAAVGDLGKALASLDKPSLLTVFSKLLSTSPHLASTISSLLPTPSLSILLASLSALERAVLSALPTGAFLRPDYIWGRVRLPLEEYVAEARRFLALFVPAQPPPPGASTSEEDLTHPSTAFQFLHALTASLIRLEAALPSPPPAPASAAASPNPLATHLTPLTLNAWHTFLTRLSVAVNSHGRVLPSSLLTSWFSRIDELCPAPPSPFDAFRVSAGGAPGEGAGGTRRAMEGVRERARREVGWLVGWKPEPGVAGTSAPGSVVGMEDEEEL
ncbi:hypothetical protein JCM8097_003102 [Rhodosporidiobolus ruineniae]